DGSAMHQFNPLTMVGSMGDAMEMEDRPHYYSDDSLWAVLAACAYLKESGDFAFLEAQVPFYEKDRHEQPVETGSVWEHLQRAVAFTHQDRGAHGLPLLGFADWNDTLNLAAGAESLLTACLYGRALADLAELAHWRGDAATAAQYQAWFAEMRARVQEYGWDGEWFISYLDAEGAPLGSHLNPAGQIYAYGQAWPVMAGFATPEQAEQALEAVYRRLNTTQGIQLSAPGFDGYDPAKGGITTYPPGAKENGGIFMHVNPWVMVAETLVGHGDRAYQYYAQTNPAAKNERIEVYECEPYVYPQNVLGGEHPQFGLARNSWLSGTAAWMYQAATQYILGVRPTYAGLRVDPCIPAGWEGFRMRRCFRGAWYVIEVRNPQHTGRGVAAVTLDGRRLADNLLPVQPGGGVHQVVVTLG
ncbi:MAG: glycosyl transferase, partial [Chloroflexi bacterium]|nr:glycosyl transferase [Chloroflexota bacterium]